MVALKIFIVMLAASAFTTCTCQAIISPRIANGAAADTMRRFPHHVNIQPIVFNGIYSSGGNENYCGGSILNERWILTSIQCVGNSDRIQVDFQKLYRNNTVGSYSAIVNNDDTSVVKYPTDYDDIALVKMPFPIIFSDTVKPISISSKSSSQMLNKLAVLPGFNAKANQNGSSKGDQLAYAMLSIVSNGICKSFYSPQVFDEYLQMCTKPWGNSKNTPCKGDSGSGLVIGWPAKPELIGIYSSKSEEDCDNGIPSGYTKIDKYEPWFNSIIYEDTEWISTTAAASF